MYSNQNEGKSVAAEGFIRTLKGKIYKKMASNNNKTYLVYLNSLVDKCKNICNHSFDKIPIDNVSTNVTNTLSTNVINYI